MHVSGSAIDRVFTPPVAPPRRFRGAIDAALTLALGSVCAFALTLGPAPLNTVAVSSAAAASFAGHFDSGPQVPLLPAEVGEASADDASGEPTPTPSDTRDAVVQSPVESSAPQSPVTAKKPEQARQPQKAQVPPRPQHPQKPTISSSPELISPSAALSVVQAYRLASGLAAFVSADECADSKVHASVTVTPSALLAPGMAKKSLAPDPAHATVSGATGALTVTVHACG